MTSTISIRFSGKRAVTAETALKLSKVLGTSPNFWMNLQTNLDLWEAATGTITQNKA